MVMSNSNELLKNFRPPVFPGSFFISFEGIEGAGKSTQILRTQSYLESRGLRVLTLREPGGTAFGEKLRRAILDSSKKIHPLAEMHLFASSRTQLLSEVTLPELFIPKTAVIYDRYLDSTLAYQGFGAEIDTSAILQAHQYFPLNLVPHLTIYLKINLETSLERQHHRNLPKDYFESRGEDFYKRVLDGYEHACTLFSDRISVVEDGGDIGEEDIFDQIKFLLKGLLERP